ncbi:ubiquinol-cytochrome c reductase iron-sulfur subunit [Blastococcus colisei]|uniref:Cytochrome bc1 complex Rieske iron-sulfur subunit n=1 Tax=Blastococcus colisei TaxID=1564162 RepID=A0A543PEM7_9ACTN|nr:Rieske (2Fe-2S) protein [Blastococcus colisei]TQN42552.1 ubiquinol-cytochrome c reductase iron-sulfur subunit [Blastococcus colisei]
MSAAAPDAPDRSGLRGPVPVAVAGATVLLFAAFVVGLVAGWRTGLIGTLLGIGLLGAAFLVAQVRPRTISELVWPDEREAGDAPVAAAVARHPVRRRWVLGGAGLGALGGIGLLAWLGRDESRRTPWRRGVHVVTADGERIRADEVPVGGFGTVWPEGSERADSASAVLVRLAGDAEPPTVLEWVVGRRIVVYSKICTHAGCPVGLYQEIDDSLFCPCHQATFDAARGAVPTFGPASRPLPQLPLGVDGDGFLVATGGFAVPVGPVRG